mgnify:CR=1 FL=1
MHTTAQRPQAGWRRAFATALLSVLVAGLAACNLEWEKPEMSVVPPDRLTEAPPKSAPPMTNGIG